MEVRDMSSSDASAGSQTQAPPVGAVDVKLEVINVPVSDVDRAKAFYEGLGWRMDIDLVQGDDFRVVQFTPPHSACSIAIGKGIGAVFGSDEMAPGSQQRLEVVVSDIEAARDDLVSRGVDVSEVFHLDGGRVPGPDPNRTSYNSYALFRDPDGNSWLLQEVTTRLPGRVWDD
jgi:catechol 2,3-dioxygenase-like lactoylglutathione lyase family enzyme